MPKQKLTFALFKELTRLEFALFGLPFVVAGALIPFAYFDFFSTFRAIEMMRFLWIVPAFMAARFSGMAFNQLIDWQIDAKNARTSARPIPSGRATPEQAGWIAWSSLFLFVALCACINFTCAILGCVAAFLLVLYSYMKRIHFLCHFVLGAIHFLGPVMAAAVIYGKFLPASALIGLMGCFSIAACDIVWAIQDRTFDLKERLHSIPANLGVERALSIARGAHLLVVVLFAALCWICEFPLLCFLGPAALAFLYFRFHQALSRAIEKREEGAIAPIFFNCNVSAPLITLLFVLIGVVWGSA